VSTTGAKADGRNGVALISRDGKRVAFGSAATNLADGDTNGAVDVFVRDLGTGTTSRASLGPLGRQADRGSSLAALSREGRYLAFLTSANLPGLSAANLYVRNTATGQTTLETASLTGGLPNGETSQAAMSGDGRYLAFASRARNLLKVTQRGSGQNLFLRDRQLGVTQLVSITTSGGAVSGYYIVDSPRVSDNGRIVAFSSDAPGLVQGGGSGHVDVFVRDMAAGTTTRVTSGANGDSFVEDMTPSGRYLVILSTATNLVPGDTNSKADVLVYDRQARTMTRASVGAGGQADDDTLSADGKVVAFASRAANLVDGDTNGVADVFARVR
jgi:Tol biopolymer transport system component